MTAFVATTTGVYPLPDWAKDALADLKGHQRGGLVSGDEGAEVTDVYDRARAEVVDLQRDAGLDRVVEGQLRWDDMLAHPLAVHDNVETGGIVRYYDNNNFYRDVRVVDELTADGDVAADLAALADLDVVPEARQAVLPGPYSLADLATDAHYGGEGDFLEAVAEFLAGEVAALPEVATLFLLEPSLVTAADGVDDAATAAIDRVADATDADVVVHTYWGALDEAVYGRLLDAAVDGVGHDFVHGREGSLELLAEHGSHDQLAVGAVAGRNSRVESPAEIRDAAEAAVERVGAVETVYLTPNTELCYLPVGRFEAKLRALAETAQTTEVTA